MAASAGVRPIETRYKGYRFRSRLEARWAVFFENLGVRWEYEPEGFHVGDEMYLPDFCVTTGELVYWYEVKPLGSKYCEKFRRFSKMITKGGTAWNLETRLLFGDPLDVFGDQDDQVCPRCGCEVKPEPLGCGYVDSAGVIHRDPTTGFLCGHCDMVTTCGGDNPAEIGFSGAKFYPNKGWITIKNNDLSQMYSNIIGAALAARQARFEHGETP